MEVGIDQFMVLLPAGQWEKQKQFQGPSSIALFLFLSGYCLQPPLFFLYVKLTQAVTKDKAILFYDPQTTVA